MLCSWLHWWLGMTRYMWSTCLLLLWCTCDLDSWLMSWGLCHKLGRSTFSFAPKRAEDSDLFFLWAEGVPGAEMHRRISVQYGNSVVSQQVVYEWIERFKNGCTSIKHEEGAILCASGSFLVLNACRTILEPLDLFVDCPLWRDTVPILHWYPSMHFSTWYTFSP
jgi:hypothetical protein